MFSTVSLSTVDRGFEPGWVKPKTIKLVFVDSLLRERPFSLNGEGGGYGFFLKKYSDSQCC